MVNVALWLLALEAIALAAFPLCYWVFPFLRDRGASVAMPFGILTLGYVSWILSALRILPSAQISVLFLLAAMTAASAWLALRRRQELREFIVRERGALIAGQIVFLALFAFWAYFRWHDPSINHTEQPMDFMMLNSAAQAFLGAPEDSWLRGETLSYYYFGFWNFGMLTKLTGISSAYTYNLAMASVPAMGGLGIFGLAVNLIGAERGRRRLALAVVGGAAAALMATLAANLEGVLEIMRAIGMGGAGFWEWLGIAGLTAPQEGAASGLLPTDNWWWWRATRVIGSFQGGIQTDYTIHEFPAFSYVLGDLHPHVMSAPFIALFLSLLWNFWRSPPLVWSPLSWRTIAPLLPFALVLAGMGFTNMWDMPTFALALFCFASLKALRARESTLGGAIAGAASLTLIVAAAAALLILPYLASFQSQVGGIGAYDGPATRPIHLLIVWGPAFVVVVPFILTVFLRAPTGSDWRTLARYALVAAFLPFAVWALLHVGGGGSPSAVFARLANALPLAALVGIGAYTTLWLIRREDGADGMGFAMALATLGAALIMGAELLYVDDSFAGAHERMNTVFKISYQAWFVFAVATGFVVYYGASLYQGARRGLRIFVGAWGAVFLVTLAGSLVYAPAALASKAELAGGERTLDGLQHVKRHDNAEYRAIEYLRDNLERGSAILEAVGGAYTDHGRVAASLGAPNPLNWPGHQLQWRGSSESFEGREQDVRTIYQTSDAEEAAALLAKYRVDYVYFGRRERDKYGEGGLAKFEAFMTPVFSDDGVVVYKK